jgi:hypothetical protein
LPRLWYLLAIVVLSVLPAGRVLAPSFKDHGVFPLRAGRAVLASCGKHIDYINRGMHT